MNAICLLCRASTLAEELKAISLSSAMNDNHTHDPLSWFCIHCLKVNYKQNKSYGHSSLESGLGSTFFAYFYAYRSYDQVGIESLQYSETGTHFHELK